MLLYTLEVLLWPLYKGWINIRFYYKYDYFWYYTTLPACTIQELGAKEVGWEVSVQTQTIYFHSFKDKWENFLFH